MSSKVPEYTVKGVRIQGKPNNDWLFDPIQDRVDFLRRLEYPKAYKTNDCGSLIGVADPLVVYRVSPHLDWQWNQDTEPVADADDISTYNPNPKTLT